MIVKENHDVLFELGDKNNEHYEPKQTRRHTWKHISKNKITN